MFLGRLALKFLKERESALSLSHFQSMSAKIKHGDDLQTCLERLEAQKNKIEMELESLKEEKETARIRRAQIKERQKTKEDEKAKKLKEFDRLASIAEFWIEVDDFLEEKSAIMKQVLQELEYQGRTHSQRTLTKYIEGLSVFPLPTEPRNHSESLALEKTCPTSSSPQNSE